MLTSNVGVFCIPVRSILKVENKLVNEDVRLKWIAAATRGIVSQTTLTDLEILFI